MSLWNCVLICFYDFFWFVVVVFLLIYCNFLMVYFVWEGFFCIIWIELYFLSLGLLVRLLLLWLLLLVFCILELFCGFCVKLWLNCFINVFIVLIFLWNEFGCCVLILWFMILWFVLFFILLLLWFFKGILVGVMFVRVIWLWFILKLSFSIVVCDDFICNFLCLFCCCYVVCEL